MFGLFILDVYVTQLMLNKEVFVDTGEAPLIVKIVFINFPVIKVAERKRSRKNEIYVYEFKAGQSYHFSMRFEELVKRMKNVPLNVGVFRENDNYPICNIQTHFSGCACDLGTLKVENPKSFIFRGPFDLVDSGNNFAGQVWINITIINMGRCMMRYYALAPKCFLFKSGSEGNEYKCHHKDTSYVAGGLLDEAFGDNVGKVAELTMDLDIDSPMTVVRDIVGISPAAEHLGRGSPEPQPPHEPLVDPRLVRKKKGKKRRKKRKK